MDTLRVAAISMNSPLGELDHVLETIEARCREAADDGAELAVFPELVVHGHCTPNTWEIAEEVPEGPSTKKLIALAADRKARDRDFAC